MHLGVDSFVSTVTDPTTGHVVGPAERMEHLLEEITLADRVGLHSFGIGEHHRSEYYDSAPAVILAAAAARTERIRLGSAVTVLSAADPVRVFQQFATLDLISKGRIDLVVGRGSFTEAFPLFGLDLADYDSLFTEKLELLLRIRDSDGGHLVGPAPPGPRPAARLPAPGAGPAADLGRRRRHARVLRPRRAAGPAPDGRGHRRRATPVRPARRPLPARGRPGGPRPRAAAGRAARVRLRRREHPGGGRHHLPGLARDVHDGLPGARLPPADARSSSTRRRARTAPSSWATRRPWPTRSAGSPTSSAAWTGCPCR